MEGYVLKKKKKKIMQLTWQEDEKQYVRVFNCWLGSKNHDVDMGI